MPLICRLSKMVASQPTSDKSDNLGGLFIPTKKEYELGDEVFMLLNLMDEAEKIPVAGKVVWITPKGAQGNRAAGIGVQFTDQDDAARSKIETYLAGALQSDRHTHTM